MFWFPWSRHRLGVDRAWQEGCSHTRGVKHMYRQDHSHKTRVPGLQVPARPHSPGTRQATLSFSIPHTGAFAWGGVYMGPSTLQAGSPNPLTVGAGLGQDWRFGSPNKHQHSSYVLIFDIPEGNSRVDCVGARSFVTQLLPELHLPDTPPWPEFRSVIGQACPRACSNSPSGETEPWRKARFAEQGVHTVRSYGWQASQWTGF